MRKAVSKRDTRKICAVKSTPHARFPKMEAESQNEGELLVNLNHPSIVKCFDYYEDDKYRHHVMQYLSGGELMKYVRQRNQLSEIEVSFIMKQAFSAVAYLHKCGIVHRDIKPENFVFSTQDPSSKIVLVDFGLSTRIKPDQILRTTIGTPFYAAPEVLLGKYDHRCDNWSLGVMMHYLLVRRYPFFEEETSLLVKRILNSSLELEGRKWRNISPLAKNLLRRLLDKNPSSRITAAEALEHPWIKKCEDPVLIQEDYIAKRKEWLENQKSLKLINSEFNSQPLTIPTTQNTSVVLLWGSNLTQGTSKTSDSKDLASTPKTLNRAAKL